ncbi:MAG: LysR family transcriptional regulator [Hyphomicrobiaceae bacterium]
MDDVRRCLLPHPAKVEDDEAKAMDIILARTFLAVAEAGSFVEAARRLHITQSTVSTRMKSLEEALGHVMFERSKQGARLTVAGEQFRRHAMTLVRVWQHAQQDVGLYDAHRDHLAIGAPQMLWDGYLLACVSGLRDTMKDIAITATAQPPAALTQRMQEGTLDLAVLYRAVQSPGLLVEPLFEEEFVMVANSRAPSRRTAGDYVFVNWAPEFELDHAAVYPKHRSPSLNLDLGSIAVDYLCNNPARGYVPMRLARQPLARRRLVEVKRERRFTYPVSMVYPEDLQEDATFSSVRAMLRRHATRLAGR